MNTSSITQVTGKLCKCPQRRFLLDKISTTESTSLSPGLQGAAVFLCGIYPCEIKLIIWETATAVVSMCVHWSSGTVYSGVTACTSQAPGGPH